MQKTLSHSDDEEQLKTVYEIYKLIESFDNEQEAEKHINLCRDLSDELDLGEEYILEVRYENNNS